MYIVLLLLELKRYVNIHFENYHIIEEVHSSLVKELLTRIYYNYFCGILSTASVLLPIEIDQWETSNYSRPQPPTDNGVRDGRLN